MSKKSLKIATWNINSIRFRINLVLHFLEHHKPDILCLQETKVVNDLFPFQQFKEAGYDYLKFNGEKSYNGVAIIAKENFLKSGTVNLDNSNEARHAFITLEDGLEIHNFYVPAGGDLPDPDLNPKYKQKLNFLESMKNMFISNYSQKDKIVILGDFNVAPLKNDVWSHKQLLNVVSHTEPEITRLNTLKDTLEWIDTARYFIDEEQKSYSWWSYRNRDWKKSNRGRRLDHIWVTPALKDTLKSYNCISSYRDSEKPSDHIPLIVELLI